MEDVKRQFDEDFPSAPGLSRCDFCMVMKPPERLRAAPCSDFILVVINDGDTGYMGCECHTEAELPPGTEAGRTGYEGAWAACAECRRDIDANRWSSVTVRALRNTTGRGSTPQKGRDLADGMQRMFRAHRLPGAWQPVSG